MKTRSARWVGAMLLMGLAVSCVSPAQGQSFKKVGVKGSVKIKQVASGSNSAWALATDGTPYIFKINKFVPAATMPLTQIAVGGGSLLQPDTVWALDGAGRIFNVVKSGTIWVFNQVPGTLDFIAAGIGYNDSCHPYEVWGLNPSAAIFRFNYCISTWEPVPGTLQTISIGGGEVWGLNGNGEIYRFDFSGSGFVKAFDGSGFLRIAVGPDGFWLTYDNFWCERELSGSFSCQDLLKVDQIQAGGDGVWVLDAAGQVFRLEHSLWRLTQVPNIVLSSISAGNGAGVFGVDSTGQVFAFRTQ